METVNGVYQYVKEPVLAVSNYLSAIGTDTIELVNNLVTAFLK